MPYIQFLGAAGVVTGSKHLIHTGDDAGNGGLQVLVDCGLFQGQKEWRERNWQDLPVPARNIGAVILTHAHLDHCGWIPRLVKEGFTGPIFATPATIELCGILLPDSGHLQEEDASFHNKHRTSKHDPALPLYTAQEATDCLRFFQPVEVGSDKQVGAGLSFRFFRAAHILGSAMAQISLTGNGAAKTLVFTGDIGRVRDTTVAPGKVVHSGPAEPGSPDVLVMESTYGNREHPETDPRPQLAQLVRQAVQRGGSVIVPAFAVERTQKFIFLLKEMMEAGEMPRVPVHVDSPMAIQAVEIFLKHAEEFSDDTRSMIAKYGSPLKWPGFYFDCTPQDSKKINDQRFPCIIVSSSGMVTGGRIQHHLIHRLPDPRNLVIFIGFQAPGTRGAQLKAGAKTIRMFGQEIPVRAQIAALEQFSDHADTRELLSWLKTFPKAPSTTYLVHGEPAAATELQQAISGAMHWNVQVAQWMQKVEV
ncbi:MAG: MBL fold metallo-hydrolase [Acidobacteria bacterium]|nr:MBL fold metallo-hydrolase [Acidobacteriota bacterium]